jgi:hypothetical protein
MAFLPSPSLLAAAAMRHVAFAGTNYTNVKIDLRGKSKDRQYAVQISGLK